MKVFLSWSGERSRLVAEFLSDWIKYVLHSTDPWLSTRDIDRGSIWFEELTKHLSKTNFGIILLTKSNFDKPWILFESGALSKGLSFNKICVFLIDLNSSEISGG